MREASLTAVAAATAFRLCLIRPSRKSQNGKGGSCCYRSPRCLRHRRFPAHLDKPSHRSPPQEPLLLYFVRIIGSKMDSRRVRRRRAAGVRSLPIAVEQESPGAFTVPWKVREASLTAVAAATAFRLCLTRPSRKSQNGKGGSCCYRSPRCLRHRRFPAHLDKPSHRSPPQEPLLLYFVRIIGSKMDSGCVRRRRAAGVRSFPIAVEQESPGALTVPWKVREASLTAVAAATAFRLCLTRPSRKSQNGKGGSCCYRSPRCLRHRRFPAHLDKPS